MVLQLKVFFPEVTIAKPKSSRNSSIGKSEYPSRLASLCVPCNTSYLTVIVFIVLPCVASVMDVMLLQRLLLSASATQSQRAFVQKTYSALCKELHMPTSPVRAKQAGGWLCHS